MTSLNATTPAADAGTRTVSDNVVIKCMSLSKVFKDFWLRARVRAVDNIDMEVRRGEVFGLLGPNGSGKSTTIKMILGLLYPTSGRISVLGKRPEDVSTKRAIGYLPEESYLYRFLNARETLDYYGRLFHQSATQRHRRIDMLLEMVGLDAAQRRPVGEYSKGMQRRIGLAQALINDPQLLILDEPTTGMDPIGTRQIKDLILDLKARGKTILLCSHLLSDVEDVCDRVAIMYGGKVRAYGTVDELLAQRGTTTLQTPALDDSTIGEIDQILRSRGGHIEKVSHPRQTLEAKFLEIVHQAQSEGAATSGARAGGRIAEFLASEQRGGHMPEEVAPQAILDALTAKEPTVQQPEAVTEPAAPAEPTADASVLADLVSPAEPAQAAAPQAPAKSEPEQPQEEQPDRDLLDSLLESDDQKKQP